MNIKTIKTINNHMAKKPKKTAQIASIVTNVNYQLALWYHSQEYKKGLCEMLTDILHTANSYHGFMFLPNKEEDIQVDGKGFYDRKYFIS
jgi:hypothetical protein